ncbi:MAG: tRNA (adenosine(37)-N6)-dimethylallyltransferase MiaA [Elusimicrobiota bacterium]
MIFIFGPTCSGKTAVALELANMINGEIISADSRQVYRHLSAGTAKPEGKWRYGNCSCGAFIVDGVPYHLVDFLEPDETFSAGEFVRRATLLAGKIKKRGGVPIITGGTGLYIRLFRNGVTPLPGRDENVRSELLGLEKKYGRPYLHKKLAAIDPVSAERIHPNNIQRMIRAIEVHQITGVPFSQVVQQGKIQHPHQGKNKMKGLKNAVAVCLSMDREKLYKRINNRVRQMLSNGMIDETVAVVGMGSPDDCPAFKSVGYRHVISYLKNKISFNYMEEKIAQDTRNYAKRQITWFKKERDTNLVDAGSGNIRRLAEKIAAITGDNRQV